MSSTIIIGFIGFIVSILWLVIGWRAMKAHESLAESTASLTNQVRKIADSHEPRISDIARGHKSVDFSKLPKIRDDQK